MRYLTYCMSQAYWVNYVNTWSALAANPLFDEETVARFNQAHRERLEVAFGKDKLLDVDYKYTFVQAQLGEPRPYATCQEPTDSSPAGLIAKL